MFNIKIDGKEYDINALSEEAKKQFASVQFVDSELQRMNAQIAVLQTARAAYSAARLTASLRERTTTLYTPRLDVSRAFPKPLCMPARFCNSIATCSSMWPGQVPSRKRCRNPPRSPTLQRCSISVGNIPVSRS